MRRSALFLVPFLVVLVVLVVLVPVAGLSQDRGNSELSDDDVLPEDREVPDEAPEAPPAPQADLSPGSPLDLYRTGRWRVQGYPDKDAYPNPVASIFRPRVDWGVFDGEGYRIPPTQLAGVVGDDDRLEQLKFRRTVAGVGGASLGAVGIGLLVAAAVLGSQPASSRTESDRATSRPPGQVGVGASTFFGLGMVGGGAGIILGSRGRQRHVARYYSRDAAEAAVEGRNNRLRKALDLSWADLELLAPVPRVREPGPDKARPGTGKGARKSGGKKAGSAKASP